MVSTKHRTFNVNGYLPFVNLLLLKCVQVSCDFCTLKMDIQILSKNLFYPEISIIRIHLIVSHHNEIEFNEIQQTKMKFNGINLNQVMFTFMHKNELINYIFTVSIPILTLLIPILTALLPILTTLMDFNQCHSQPQYTINL